MYLVLDNANYHKPRDDTWISCSKALNKHELAHQLLDLGVTQLTTVDDSPRTVQATSSMPRQPGRSQQG